MRQEKFINDIICVNENLESILAARDRRVTEARKFNLLSNVFMSVALDDKDACEYVLKILTGIKDLKVKEIRSQYRISKIHSHDAILDILAEDSTGQLYNLEIQRSETIDHARRGELPDVYIIYISETDLWKAGYTVYPVKKYFENTALNYVDGQYISYVNAEVDDGSETAKLMKYFKTADPNDMTHGELSKRVHYLKCEEGGYEEMCEVSEKIYREGIEDGRISGLKEGRKEGWLESQKETAKNLFEMGMSADTIAQALKVNVKLVQEWLTGSRSPAR